MVYLKLILSSSLAAFFLLLSPACAADNINKGSTLRIALSEAVMKSAPRAFGSSLIRTLPKGAAVTYLGTSGIYYKVNDGRNTGYISSKSVVKSTGFTSFSRSGEVTQSDMAAATKGFSPEVERENRKNRRLRYDLMDRAEQVSTVTRPETSLKGFRKEGRLGEYANE
ncbi:SH3 domain-containing protein [Mariprofundus aestuarium]|uniref:SH3 domain-containing protein n=1 Tax=Mariprofundus aestuarium TaxID=1921086 RepID=A0A2K8KX99_MARES|nr:SH3 domain-containing protein [Mariprofundus aestuarium]ATX79483.1 SH3 domain-containing protein [Mariprofundus aestuarium]